MNKAQYDQLYLDLCEVVDDMICGPYPHVTPSTMGRKRVNQLLEVLARHGIVIEPDPATQTQDEKGARVGSETKQQAVEETHKPE